MTLRHLFPIVFLLSVASSNEVVAQQPERLFGVWTGCFQVPQYPAPACGRVLLDSARACLGLGMGTTHGEGIYDIAFDSLIRGAPPSESSWPDVQATFTWTAVTPDSLTITRRAYPASTPEGEPICPIFPTTAFEASGRINGDSLQGSWAWYGGQGNSLKGTFTLTRSR
jgi:hypothetical protein